MMKIRFGVSGIFLASILIAGSVQAKEAAIESKVDLLASQTSVLNGHRNVEIGYETHAEMSGVCDLTLYSFAYDDQKETLSLVAKSEEPCLNDSYGKRTGAMVWRVPDSMIRQSRSLTIFINGEKAGLLFVKNGQALLIPENLNFN